MGVSADAVFCTNRRSFVGCFHTNVSIGIYRNRGRSGAVETARATNGILLISHILTGSIYVGIGNIAVCDGRAGVGTALCARIVVSASGSGGSTCSVSAC